MAYILQALFPFLPRGIPRDGPEQEQREDFCAADGHEEAGEEFRGGREVGGGFEAEEGGEAAGARERACREAEGRQDGEAGRSEGERAEDRAVQPGQFPCEVARVPGRPEALLVHERGKPCEGGCAGEKEKTGSPEV